MQIVYSILAFLTCTPFWVLLIWLFANAMDFLVDAVDSLDDSGVHLIIKPIAGLVVSFVVPMVFISLGITIWAIAEQIFCIA